MSGRWDDDEDAKLLGLAKDLDDTESSRDRDRWARWQSRESRTDDGHVIGQVEVIRETGRAILVRGRGLSPDPFGLSDPNEEDWIPLSQLHVRSEVRNQGDCGLLVISTWLAEKKGLVG